jgi:hypothetical protein
MSSQFVHATDAIASKSARTLNDRMAYTCHFRELVKHS